MLILCRIAMAEAGKPYRKDTPRQLPIWNDCVSVFYIRVCLHFTLFGGNLTAQSTGSHREIGGGIQIPKAYFVSFTSFSRPATRVPRRTRSQANVGTAAIHQESIYKNSEGRGEGKRLRSKILLNFYITNYSLFFFVVMHLFASFRNK